MSDNKNQEINYWRSFGDLYNDPQVAEASQHEFKEGVTEDFSPGFLSAVSRRKFLALIGASSALAAAGCSSYRDKGDIIPYVQKPEEVIPGKAVYYSSTCTACDNGCGILVKTREGRPIKIDGNPDHPVNTGKVCSKGQSNILNLYDPERLQYPLKKGSGDSHFKIEWKNADAEILEQFQKNDGKEIAIISRRIISPSTLKVLKKFQNKYQTAKLYSYEFYSDQNLQDGWKKFTGNNGTFPLIKYNEARVILALESDFLGTEGNTIENSRLFIETRDVNSLDKFSKLYSVEGNMSLTGMNADSRISLRPDALAEFVSVLIKEVSGFGRGALKDFAQKYKLPITDLESLLNDLLNNQGRSIVVGGFILSVDTHMAINHLNNLLGNASLYSVETAQVELLPLSSKEEINSLVGNMKSGKVGAVIHFDSNPVYHLPGDFGYLDGLKSVPVIISLCEKSNETTQLSHYVLPINHDLESWNDINTRNGLYSFQQPVIYPIFNTRQKESILLHWSSDVSKYSPDVYKDFLKDSWKNEIFPSLTSSLSFESFWDGALHDGIAISKGNGTSFNFSGSFQEAQINSVSGYALALKQSYSVGDGRFSGNGWMQELPHPVSKITWDNYAAISKKTAEDLGVQNNDIIEVQNTAGKLNIPVYIVPGCADNTISIELGYGRSNNGTVSEGVGFNANNLLSKEKGISPLLFTNVKVKNTGDTYKLVTSQEHHAFDKGLTQDVAQKRHIIREGTLEEYKKDSNFLFEGDKKVYDSMYPKHTDLQKGLKWGMAIDLNKCLGCGECVIACNSENNIPVVGKDQVEKGREMHWLRIDRYYSGNPDNPKVSVQPMLCQHCDNAPCENVCPVVATTHSTDGLNQMIYNRCVGTRYCSNNCPYKVRRFNFFNFRDHFNDAIQESALFSLIYNPEVTIRSRGVMEKCTFCIQRIMEGREDAIRENRQLKGSDIKTACQEGCITNAITFGDMNEPTSELSKLRKHNLGYHLLEDLNTKPNVTYLAKLRNISKEKV